MSKTSRLAVASKGLGNAMRTHIVHGIAGMSWRQIASLEARGILHESAERPGYDVLSPLGLVLRTMFLLGREPSDLSDDERVRFRGFSRGVWTGPAEWGPCEKHPGEGRIFRWCWSVEFGAEEHEHVRALEVAGEPEVLAPCPLCEEEARAAEEEEP